jgi:hypothetical protein
MGKSLTVYWILFAYFALGALLRADRADRAEPQLASSFFLFCGVLGIALIVGLRFEVGGDWYAYKRIFAHTAFADLGEALSIGDPGYQFLNWVVQKFGAGFWMVNLTCATIFSWGLWRFAKVQPSPWLTLLVAIPYLVIVVAMGYTRQAVAIGFIMAGLAALQRGVSPIHFAAYVIAAALFHKTAVVVLPLVLFASHRNTIINVMIGVALTYLLYILLVANSADILVRNYLIEKYDSEGAAIRVAMGVLPAALFLLVSRRFGLSETDRKIWRNFSLAALGFLGLLLALPSSAAVDRLSLYALPLQLIVLPRIPEAVRSPGLGRLAIVVYCLAVQFVWLNYADNAAAWVPYHFYPTAT